MMAYEHKSQPLASKKVFFSRIWKNLFVATLFLAFCLLIGILGNKWTIPEFSWYDSLLNASMILSGMGPMVAPEIHMTNIAKVFASMYAIFSGVAFISAIGMIITPVAHRLFHKLNIEEK